MIPSAKNINIKLARARNHCLTGYNVRVEGRAAATQDKGAMHPARPRGAKSQQALFRAAGSVKGNADEEQHHAKHDDTDKNVHGYNLPICSIRRSIWR